MLTCIADLAAELFLDHYLLFLAANLEPTFYEQGISHYY